MHQIVAQIIQLAVDVLIAWLVFRYYKERQFPAGERYSTFGPRFWTGTVDACVIWPLSFVLTLLFTLHLPTAVSVVLIIIQNLAWLAYTVVMHAKYGQTVGKMVCKVRVVDHGTEGAISVRQACLREGIPLLLSFGLVAYEVYMLCVGKFSDEPQAQGEMAKSAAFWWLAALPMLWFFAEVVTMLTNEKRRALHDMIAGTVVVRTNVSE